MRESIIQANASNLNVPPPPPIPPPPPLPHSSKEQGGQQSIVSQGPGSTTGGRRSRTHTSEDDAKSQSSMGGSIHSVGANLGTTNDFNTQQNSIKQIDPKYLKR